MDGGKVRQYAGAVYAGGKREPTPTPPPSDPGSTWITFAYYRTHTTTSTAGTLRVMVTREIRRALVGKQSEPASGAWMCHKDWSPNYTVGALAYDPWGRAIIGPIHCLVMNLGVRVSARIVPAKELQYRVEGEIRLVTTPTIDPSLPGLIMVREFGRINW